jgi:hypothetical protein
MPIVPTEILFQDVTSTASDSRSSARASLEILDTGTCTICTVTRLDGRYLAVKAPVPLRHRMLVRLEWDGQLVLGEIDHSESHRSIVRIEHLLNLDNIPDALRADDLEAQ